MPFLEALERMTIYARFMKDMLIKKMKFIEEKTIDLEVGWSAIIQKSFPPNMKTSEVLLF